MRVIYEPNGMHILEEDVYILMKTYTEQHSTTHNIINSDHLTIKEVASRYGEKLKCMFYDYDNILKEEIMLVNSSLLKYMEQCVIKYCFNTDTN